jgi:single-stranded-DNA-specific exonuclease
VKNNSIWREIETNVIDVDSLASSTGLSKILAKLLLQRGIKSRVEAEKFLNPSLENICNPFKLKDVDKAVVRLEKALNKNEKIYVYGDYDCDGVVSTSLLVMGFKQLGFNIDYYIPNRDEGYSLNKEAILKISQESSLIITVDCGISSADEVSYANSLGIDVIITDHHEISSIPPAYAVVNPKRTDNIYDFTGLAGVGTAFMLLYAVYLSAEAPLESLFKFLDIVCIGTVSDMVPLISENRIFVKYGLNYINKSSNLALRFIKSRLFPNKDISTTDISFSIAPIFNAAGRVEDPKIVVEFLTSDDPEHVNKLYDELISMNKDRQVLSREALILADSLVEVTPCIVVNSKDFHQGILGILASKLVDKHRVASIALKLREDGTLNGSARSINNFNLVNSLEKCKDLLIKYGGHANAAGITLHSDNLEAFKERINKIAKEHEDSSETILNFSAIVHDFDISVEFYKIVERLKPFGVGNEEPLFVLKDVEIRSFRRIGKDKNHAMFDLISFNRIKNAVWFKSADTLEGIDLNTKYDIAFNLGENYFNNRIYPKVYVKNIKKSEQRSCYASYYRDLYEKNFPIQSEFLSVYDIPKASVINYSNDKYYYNDMLVPLNDELTNLLYFLRKNYNHRFKIDVIESIQKDDLFLIKIEVNKLYNIKKRDLFKDQTLEIKRSLIGNFDYNKMQKNVLRNIIIEKKAQKLGSYRGRGIDTAALSIAMHFYALTGQKSLYVTENSVDEIVENFFVVRNEDSLDFDFRFIDDGIDFINNGLFLKFYDKSKTELPSDLDINDSFIKRKNITIVKENRGYVYSRSLDIFNKNTIVKKVFSNEQIVANSEIYALAILEDH